MKRFSALFVLLLFIACGLIGCAGNTAQKPSRNVSVRTNKIAIVYDSKNVLLMAPKAAWFEQQLKAQGILCTLLDIDGRASGYEDALKNLVQSDIGGLIISIPYDSAAETIFADALKKGIKILQVGGNFFPSDISISVDYNQIGYMLGRELGGRLNKLKVVPKVLFLSLESGWKEIETEFIEGLREMAPDACIVGRQIISTDSSIAFCDGETDLSHVNGVAAFFCDTDSSAISYNTSAIQVRAISQNNYKNSDNLKAVLLTTDDGTSQAALQQLIDLLGGKQTNTSNSYYKPVFVYSAPQ
jgi:DNA-binding LacI/PurR family transcriptional regulator